MKRQTEDHEVLYQPFKADLHGVPNNDIHLHDNTMTQTTTQAYAENPTYDSSAFTSKQEDVEVWKSSSRFRKTVAVIAAFLVLAVMATVVAVLFVTRTEGKNKYNFLIKLLY